MNCYEKQDKFILQAKDFIRSIKNKEEPFVKAEDGLEAARIIDAIYRSAKTNQWININ